MAVCLSNQHCLNSLTFIALFLVSGHCKWLCYVFQIWKDSINMFCARFHHKYLGPKFLEEGRSRTFYPILAPTKNAQLLLYNLSSSSTSSHTTILTVSDYINKNHYHKSNQIKFIHTTIMTSLFSYILFVKVVTG